MTISENDGYVQITATGGETNLAFDFKIYEKEHLTILRTPSGGGSPTTLVLDTDYTIANDQLGQDLGGTAVLTTPATVGQKYTLLLDGPYERDADYNQAGDFFANTLNLDFDRLVQMVLQLRRESSRSLQYQDDINLSNFVLTEAPQDGRALMFDGTGGNVKNGPNAADITSAQSYAAAALASKNAAEIAETNAETAEAAAEAARDAALAAVGSVKVTASDTTPAVLDTTIAVSGLLTKTVTSPGGNEGLTLAVPAASQAEAEAGTENTKAMTALRVSQAVAALVPSASTSTAGKVQLADQAAMEAQTSGRAVTANVQHFHPCASKAWVRFQSTGTVSIAASYNVTSVTDVSVGNWTVNLSVTIATQGSITSGFQAVSSTNANTVDVAWASSTTINVRGFSYSGGATDLGFISIDAKGDI